MASLMRAFPPEQRGVVMGWRQLAVPLGGTIGAVALPLLARAGGVRLALAACAVAVTVTSVGFGLLVGHAPAVRTAETRSGLRDVLRVPKIRPATRRRVRVHPRPDRGDHLLHPGRPRRRLQPTEAAVGFTLVNVVAGISRPLWGRLADSHGGTRRMRTLRETGMVGAAAAVIILPALHAGVVPGLAATAVLAFGVFGFNGLLYLIVGELAGSARSGVAVGVASTVVFGGGALIAPAAGLAVEHLGYGALWAIAAASGATGAAIAWRFLPSPAARPATPAGLVAPAPGCPEP